MLESVHLSVLYSPIFYVWPLKTTYLCALFCFFLNLRIFVNQQLYTVYNSCDYHTFMFISTISLSIFYLP